MAVFKSTIADTKVLGEGWNKLTEAIERYGKHSKQARTATEELHQSMRSLGNTLGVKAELKLAKSAQTLNKLWDLKTSGARVQAVNISEQGLGFATQMVPHIAHWAQMNLSIINKDLKPLFKWLEGPEAMGIFANLERKFKEGLPTGMHAFGQGVEFVLKTVNALQKYTGKLIKEVDKLLTYANSPMGFAKWEGIMGSLIKDFHAWWDLIKVTGRDLYDLFSQDAHTGRSIVEEITQMLEKLGEWERSVAGKRAIHNIFVVHKEEVLELLKVLPPLLSTFGKIYMTVAPPLVKALTAVAGAFAKVLETLEKVPGGAWVLGLGLIAARLKLLIPLLGLFQKTAIGGALAGGFKGRSVAAAGVGAGEVGPGGAVGATTAEGAGASGLLAGAARGAGSLLRIGAYGLGGYFAGEAAKGAIGGKPGTTTAELGELAKEVGLFGGIGAGVGSVVPVLGTGVGALVGGAVGAGKFGLETLLAGGGAPSSSAPALTQFQRRTQALQSLQRGFSGLRKTLASLEVTEANLTGAQHRHKQAVDALATAHHRLNVVIARYGSDSRQAAKAQLALADAQVKDARSAREVRRAHQLKGAERAVARLELEKELPQTLGALPGLRGHAEVAHEAFRREPTLRRAKAWQREEHAVVEQEKNFEVERIKALGLLGKRRLRQIEDQVRYEAKLRRKLGEAPQLSHAGKGFVESLEKWHGGFEKAGEKGTAAYAEGLAKNAGKESAEASKKATHGWFLGNSPGGVESQETLSQTKKAGKTVAQQYAVGLQSQVSRVAVAGTAIVDALFSSLSAPSGGGGPARAAGPHARGKGGMSAGFVAGRELGMELAKGAASDARHLRRAGASGAAGARFAGAFSRGRFTFPLPRGSWTAGSVDQGWDISAPGGTPLLAVGAGTIMGHGISGFGPWAPILKLDSGGEVYYGHAGPGHELRTGTHVRAGQVIGEVGKGIVGMSSGPHLEVGFYPPGPMGAGSKMKHALGYATGGRVPGMRQPRDNMPIMASSGEFVVTGGGEHMLERMTGVPRVLDRLEHVQPSHFAGGGRVGPLAGSAAVASSGRVHISFDGATFHLSDKKQMHEFAVELANTIEHTLRNLPEGAAEPTFAT